MGNSQALKKRIAARKRINGHAYTHNGPIEPGRYYCRFTGKSFITVIAGDDHSYRKGGFYTVDVKQKTYTFFEKLGLLLSGRKPFVVEMHDEVRKTSRNYFQWDHFWSDWNVMRRIPVY